MFGCCVACLDLMDVSQMTIMCYIIIINIIIRVWLCRDGVFPAAVRVAPMSVDITVLLFTSMKCVLSRGPARPCGGGDSENEPWCPEDETAPASPRPLKIHCFWRVERVEMQPGNKLVCRHFLDPWGFSPYKQKLDVCPRLILRPCTSQSRSSFRPEA